MTTQLECWATDAAHDAADRLGLPWDAVVMLADGVGLRLPGGAVASISYRSSYPRAELLRKARRMMKAG